ncbi:structural protein [Synechococcus T7-like virus S-TIP28]|uniref:Structural protein n=1 Tax=Synechococcus T7-like virus S-TIP28 TaxID=1332140 RepID=A0AAE8XF31_9CAUD|nr:structural protein [Synechococcus T7-like virus S-TIP28]
MSFPSNPSLGDQYTEAGTTYEWFGPATRWQRIVTAAQYEYGPNYASLDEVRTDGADTVFTYSAGRLIKIESSDVVKDLTYNADGTLSSIAITTDTESVTKTFSYQAGVLTSFTTS